MDVEIGTDAALFLFWKYLFQFFCIGSLQCTQPFCGPGSGNIGQGRIVQMTVKELSFRDTSSWHRFFSITHSMNNWTYIMSFYTAHGIMYLYCFSSANISVFYPKSSYLLSYKENVLVQSTIVQSFGKLENSAMDSAQQQYTTFSYLLLKQQFNDHVISY